MRREKKDKHFIHKPVYPGGREALRKFVTDNLVYPETAKAAAVKGTVKIDYTIDHQGKVVDAKVISGLGHDFDEEAIRVVKLLRFEVPKQRVRRVHFHKSINIHFRPPLKKKVAKPAPKPADNTSRTIQYHIKPITKKKKEDGKKGGGGYSYSVEF